MRLGGLGAVVGGLLWIVKFAVIALRDDNFEPLESVVFLGGLVGMIVGAVGVAALVARRESPWPRVGLFLLLFVAAGVGSFLLQIGVQAAVNAAVDADNVGISEEAGILFIGVLWLGVGVALTRRSRRPRPA